MFIKIILKQKIKWNGLLSDIKEAIWDELNDFHKHKEPNEVDWEIFEDSSMGQEDHTDGGEDGKGPEEDGDNHVEGKVGIPLWENEFFPLWQEELFFWRAAIAIKEPEGVGGPCVVVVLKGDLEDLDFSLVELLFVGGVGFFFLIGFVGKEFKFLATVFLL